MTNGDREYWGYLASSRQAGRSQVSLIEADVFGDDVAPHEHEEEHALLILKGAYLSDAIDAPHFINRPRLIFNPSGTGHRDRFAGPGGEFLAISYAPGTFRIDKAECVFDIGRISLAMQIARELKAPSSALRLEELLLLLPHEDQGGSCSAPPDWLRRAFEAANEGDPRTLCLATIAADAGVHPGHLVRAFKKHCGQTLSQVMRARRMERAVELLRRDRLPLAQVAMAAGYYDQAHLTNEFRARLGMTPRSWRMAHAA